MKKRLKDAIRRPIVVANDKPIMDSRMYEVEYSDGYVAAMLANVIAENLFAQVDQEGKIFVLIKTIIKTRTDGTQTLQQNVFVVTKSITRIRKIQLKDRKTVSNGSMTLLHGTDLKISRICIQYKWHSTRLRIEFWRIQYSHGGLNTF